MRKKQNPASAILKKTAIAILIILIFFLMLEAALRVCSFFAVSNFSSEPLKAEFDSNLGWAYKPSQEGFASAVDYNIALRTNSLGFRDSERSPEKENGIFRIVFLGDSYVFGDGLDENQRFSSIIEEHCFGCEALNFGVAGYSTDQELLLLRQKALSFKPDLVVLGLFLGNDVEDNAVPFPANTTTSKPFFELKNGKLELKNFPAEQNVSGSEENRYFLLEFKRWLGQNFYSYSFLVSIARGIPFLNNALVSVESGQDYSHSLELTLAIIREMQKTCEESNSEFLVLILPTRDQIAKQADKRNAWADFFAQKFSENKIGFINAFEEFKKNPGEYHFKSNDHFNPEGSAFVAELIKQKISSAHPELFQEP